MDSASGIAVVDPGTGSEARKLKTVIRFKAIAAAKTKSPQDREPIRRLTEGRRGCAA